MLAGWGRAILLQLAHPLVAQGVADHSGFAKDPRGRVRRLERTIRAMLALTFGTAEEAVEAAAAINKIHDRVNGRLREGAGVFAAGTGYSAHDPALLAWVHATLVDTFLLTYERFVAPLSAVDRDSYCREAGGVAPLLGIPPDALPRSTEELAAYMERMLSSGEIVVTGAARSLAREVLAPGLPWPARPLPRAAGYRGSAAAADPRGLRLGVVAAPGVGTAPAECRGAAEPPVPPAPRASLAGCQEGGAARAGRRDSVAQGL